MEHNNERTIGLKQLRDLSRKHFPEIMSLICKELNEETDRMALELARRNARLILGPPPPKAEIAYLPKLSEEALKDIKLDYEKFKESTNAKLEAHGKKFATVKKINQTFIELFKIVNENTQTIFNLTNKR